MLNTKEKFEDSAKLFEVVQDKQCMDSRLIESAQDLFYEYKEKHIILNEHFRDDKWIINNEYVHKGVYFNINKQDYKKNFEKQLGISFDTFKNYFKTFLILSIGEIESNGLWKIANDVKKLIRVAISDFRDMDLFYIKSPYQIGLFFELLPVTNEDIHEEILNSLNIISELQTKETMTDKRTLADFICYLKFNEILEEFWKSNMNSKDRLFFYPVYLWWKITSIIPTRPREFLLTPRDCIYIKEKQPYLILRKTKLKGGKTENTARIGYTIEADYIKVEYPITKELYDTIQVYIDHTNEYENNELNTLFLAEPHYQYWDKSKIKLSRFYTYVNLSCALRIFFYDILNKKYGYQIIHEKIMENITLPENTLSYIHLGDTRHLAMINAILEGGSPEMVMQLAGHSDIEISSHYYTNIAHLIECKTYTKYKEMISDKQEYLMGKNFYTPITNNEYIEIEDGGKCYSPQFINGNIEDCICASGPNGEIGYCYNCSYFRKNGSFYYVQDDNPYLSHLQKDTQLLSRALNRYRENKGYEEDIKEAVLKLQNSSYEYQRYFTNKIHVNKENMEERTSNGKTKTN